MGRPKSFSRDDVLERALPVFWKQGFAGTSLQDLERATGVNKSGLYSEFRDKEDLFLECLRHYLESLGNRGTSTREPLGWKNVGNISRGRPPQQGRTAGMFRRQLHAGVRYPPGSSLRRHHRESNPDSAPNCDEYRDRKTQKRPSPLQRLRRWCCRSSLACALSAI